MIGGAVNESGVLQSLFVSVLTALAPAAGSNVYLPAPELPNGVYEGTYPYIAFALTEYSVTDIEAANIKRTDESTPNIWTFDLVDQLVSESGTTLNATELFLLSFIDAVNVTFNRRTARYLIDGSGIGQATDCGMTVKFVRNPAGPAEMRAGAASIVLRGSVPTLSLPISPSNT